MEKLYKALPGKVFPVKAGGKLVFIKDDPVALDAAKLDYISRAHLQRGLADKDIEEVQSVEPGKAKRGQKDK